MRLTQWGRNEHVPTLNLPRKVGTDEVEALLRRVDPELVRHGKRMRLLGSTKVHVRGNTVTVEDNDRLARGIGHHLGGTWQVAPPPPQEYDEPLEDMLRIYVPRKLLPAEVATLLRPALPDVAIREDSSLAGLFWFEDDKSDLNVSAWTTVTEWPAVLGPPRPGSALYECGIDDVTGPTRASAAQAWQIAEILEKEAGGVPVDRFGFRVTSAQDLLPR